MSAQRDADMLHAGSGEIRRSPQKRRQFDVPVAYRAVWFYFRGVNLSWHVDMRLS
jgi:hypothetical protein